MPLGRLLEEARLLEPGQVEEARRRQKLAGGSLGDNCVALGLLSRDQLDRFVRESPPAPTTIEETGLDDQFLLNFVLKAIYVVGLETVNALSDYLKLPVPVLDDVLGDAKTKRLVEITGMTQSAFPAYRYAITSHGRQLALESLQQCLYVGPAPVPLEEYQAQVSRQAISNEKIGAESVTRALSHLVLPDDVVPRLGPALNAGKAILLYGASGNGKTSIAEALAETFEQSLFIPHCVEVDGQIIKIYDPVVHHQVEDTNAESNGSPESPECDPRWVKCRRPTVMTGGELTMEMLDLSFDPVSKYYEAPAHMKATGGVFVIDDFGRQRVSTIELLNRWILPLERRIDFLTLHTGKKLCVPFDELVMFSTNFAPEELMDEAGLRRIPYKMRVEPPTPAQYSDIFRKMCEIHGLALPDAVLTYLLEVFYPETGKSRAGSHPKAIVEHVMARCDFEHVERKLTTELIRDAVRTLFVTETPPEA